MDYVVLLLVIFLSILLVAGGLGISLLLAPHRPGQLKNSTYECGEETIGSAWMQFNVGFYIFGLLFLVFDVEAAFLFPWAVVVKTAGVTALLEAFGFIGILVFGLFYAWRKGVLEWV
jgi:NADH-quinone oxidoreductase subunit A